MINLYLQTSDVGYLFILSIAGFLGRMQVYQLPNARGSLYAASVVRGYSTLQTTSAFGVARFLSSLVMFTRSLSDTRDLI